MEIYSIYLSSLQMGMVAVYAICILILVWLWRNLFVKKCTEPPGPKGWPLLGNCVDLLTKSPLQLLDTWKQFGDVCKVSMMGSPLIIVSGEESLREMLVTKSNDFAGRDTQFRSRHFLDGCDNVGLSSYSPKWLKMKKALMQSLKMYGERLNTLEEVTVSIMTRTLQEMNQMPNEPFVFKDVIHRAVTDILGSIIFGQALDEESVKGLLSMNDEMLQTLQPFGNGCELDMAPWLRFLPNKNFSRLNEAIKTCSEWCQKEKSKYLCDLETEQPMSVLDSLAHMFKHDVDENHNRIVSDGDLNKVMLDLVVAGTTTTVATICSLIALLSERQHIQEKLQEEIDTNIGERTPSLGDRNDCHYIQATILEILRYQTVGPIGIPHKTTRDTTIGQYKIAKGTQVWPNFWSLHHDSEFWGDPWEFRPERFLDDQGQVFAIGHPLRKRLMAFGAGRRVCPGEAMAKSRLFLMTAMMLQKFTFLPGEGANSLPTNPRDYALSFVLEPRPFKVKIVSRNLSNQVPETHEYKHVGNISIHDLPARGSRDPDPVHHRRTR